MKDDKIKILGECPICDREMWDDNSSDKHHMVPKCKGGRSTEYLHKICHRKIHSLFTEKELAKEYNNPEIIRSHPEMQKFIIFVKNKPPNFYDKNVQHKRKRKRK